ncbi:MAG: hypothetical protein AAGA96_01900 [Verrucomicrobiota bacterium]
MDPEVVATTSEPIWENVIVTAAPASISIIHITAKVAEMKFDICIVATFFIGLIFSSAWSIVSPAPKDKANEFAIQGFIAKLFAI